MRSGAKMKHLSTLKIRIFFLFFFLQRWRLLSKRKICRSSRWCCLDLAPRHSSRLGMETGWRTVSAVRSRRLPRRHHSSPGNTHWGILILSPFTPLKICCWAMRGTEAGHHLHNGAINCDLLSTGWEDWMLQKTSQQGYCNLHRGTAFAWTFA